MKLQVDFLKSVFLLVALLHFSFPEMLISVYTKKIDYLVGDKINVEIMIVHPKDVKVSISTPNDYSMKPFSVLSYNLSSPTPLGKDSVKQIINLDLSLYTTGHFILNPIILDLIDKENKIAHVSTLPFPIVVKSILSDNKRQTPFDIKEIFSTNYTLTLFLYAFLTALFLFLIFFIVRSLIRKQKKKLSLIQKILRSLESLLKENYLTNGAHRLFFYQFSSIIKTFLEAYFKKPYTSMTTTEIEKQLSLEKIELAPIFLDILKYSDKVKFLPDHSYDYEKTLLFVKDFRQVLKAEEEKNRRKK